MRYITRVEAVSGTEIGRRAAGIIEGMLNSGWDFETSFVYHSGPGPETETLYLIFSRRSH